MGERERRRGVDAPQRASAADLRGVLRLTGDGSMGLPSDAELLITGLERQVDDELEARPRGVADLRSAAGRARDADRDLGHPNPAVLFGMGADRDPRPEPISEGRDDCAAECEEWQ